MARPLRLEYEHAIWHVTARGNEQRDIFRDDTDRERFVLMLSQTVTRFGWRLFAWVLMSNHYHLLIQTPQPNLSRGMHWLNARYAQWFNLRHDRRGHLFQGRFHGALIEKESYLLTVARYVVLNPVRAGLVENPADWYWSSYRQTAGIEAPAPWLGASELLETFGGAAPRGCKEYVAFVEQDRQPSPWMQLVGQMYLGTKPWITQIEGRITSAPRSPEHPRLQLELGRPTLDDILNVVAKTFDSTIEHLQAESGRAMSGKSVAAFIAFEDGLHRQTDIATALAIRGRSSVSAIVRRCRDALIVNEPLRELVAACRSQWPRYLGSAPLRPPDPHLDGDRPWFRTRASRSY